MPLAGIDLHHPTGHQRRRVNSHLFRHSFAAEALRRGINPVQLAQLLGHSRLRMIEHVYAHLSAADGYEVVMKMLPDVRL